MSEFTRKGTEALKGLADEVEQERNEKGHTVFDDVPESDGGVHSSTREDYEGGGDSLDELDDPARAGIVGHAGRLQGRPGL